MIWFRPSVGETCRCTSVQHGATETVSTYWNAFVCSAVVCSICQCQISAKYGCSVSTALDIKSHTDWPGIEIGSSRLQTCGDRVTTKKLYVCKVSWYGVVKHHRRSISPQHGTFVHKSRAVVATWTWPISHSLASYLFTARDIINHLQLWRQLLMFMSFLLSKGPRDSNGCS